MVSYHPLVQDLKEYVLRSVDRKKDFDEAMASAINPINGGGEEMEAEGIKNIEDYYGFCHKLLHWVPDVGTKGDALLRKILVFYWLFNQPELSKYQDVVTPQYIGGDPKWLSYWQLVFAREIGRFLDTRGSASGIHSFYENPNYNKESHLWQDEPANGWASFNQFFSRRWKDIKIARPLSDHDKDEVIVSVADSKFNGHWSVENGCVDLKGFAWPISKLLQEEEEEFNGKSFMHAFLGPSDYHRQHAPVSGRVVKAKVIQEQVYLQVTKKPDQVGLIPDHGLFLPGKRMVPSKRMGDKGGDFYDLDAPDEAGYQWRQTRGLIIIETEKHGKVAILPIGMAQVSSVVLSVSVDQWVDKGDEISYFMFGGSDYVMVFEREVKYEVEKGKKCNVRSRIGVFE